MFPKKGKVFPSDSRRANRELDYPSAIAAALRKEQGDTHQAIKTLMRWTGANERTVKNWLAGTNGPNGKHLVGILRHSDGALDALLRLSDRQFTLVGLKVVDVRYRLKAAIEQIDTLIGERAAER